MIENNRNNNQVIVNLYWKLNPRFAIGQRKPKGLSLTYETKQYKIYNTEYSHAQAGLVVRFI